MKLFSALVLGLTALVSCGGEALPKNWITVSGELLDVFHDPTDSFYDFFYLRTADGDYYATWNKKQLGKADHLEQAIGAKVSVTGLLVPCDQDFTRLYSGREIRVKRQQDFVLVAPPPENRFACPNEDTLWQVMPGDITAQSFRCIRGTVLAAWNGDNVLIRSARNRIVEAELRTGPLPQVGETVDLVGLPETTLYTLHLHRALWRSVAPPRKADASATPLHAEKIATEEYGHPGVNMRQHGRTLRLTGIVRSLPKPGFENSLLYLDDNGFTVPVNANAAHAALTDVSIGSTVEVTGVCVMHVDVWRPHAVFPRIRGYTLITRSADDIRVLAHPSWMTPARTLVIVGILFAGLVGILLWNRALRIKSERRGRELAASEIERAESDLRTSERTRLAIELHDALSQTLTAVSMEIETAEQFLDGASPELKAHLGIAAKALDSCRSDLRNCLWDLRNDALGVPTMEAAIRTTLLPHVRDVTLAVRFGVPREMLSDSTAHSMLCIIRELTVNAIRHGRATHVAVAGAIEDGRLLFSVRDNGRGFDCRSAVGVAQGHFGLQGIRERVRQIGGTFDIDSSPRGGTKAVVRIALPKPQLQSSQRTP